LTTILVYCILNIKKLISLHWCVRATKSHIQNSRNHFIRKSWQKKLTALTNPLDWSMSRRTNALRTNYFYRRYRMSPCRPTCVACITWSCTYLYYLILYRPASIRFTCAAYYSIQTAIMRLFVANTTEADLRGKCQTSYFYTSIMTTIIVYSIPNNWPNLAVMVGIVTINIYHKNVPAFTKLSSL